jgi:hypothetical protein
VYPYNRRFLPPKHPLKKKGKHFNGKAEPRGKPVTRTSAEVFDMVKDLKVIFGKGPGSQPVPNGPDKHAPIWKKKSIFWELPYWEVHEVCSAIDVMHLIKNLYVNILGFMGLYGKSKDTPEAREDQERHKGLDGMHPGQFQGRASYALTKEEKEIFFEVLFSIKVPTGFSSNIKGIVNMTFHLVEEIRILDPMFLYNMFPFERFMGVLKKYVLNRARPEGSISKGYGTEEVIEFCVDFLPDLKPISVSESRYEGRLTEKGTLGRKAKVCMDGHSFSQAHYTVLHNSTMVAPYIVRHKNILRSKNPRKADSWIKGEHEKTFGSLLQTHLMNNNTVGDHLYYLARPPSSTICTFQGYEINRSTFYTVAQDKKSTTKIVVSTLMQQMIMGTRKHITGT